MTVGQQFTLSWQGNYATSCTASGGGADGSRWTGSPVLPGGQMQITASVAGSFTYTLACVGQVPSDTQTTHATVTVMSAASSSSSAGNGSGGGGIAGTGHGGGGAEDPVSLFALALLVLMRCRSTGSFGCPQLLRSKMRTRG